MTMAAEIMTILTISKKDSHRARQRTLKSGVKIMKIN